MRPDDKNECPTFCPSHRPIPPGSTSRSEFVTHAWIMPQLAVQHVLVRSEDPNVFLALVLDLDARCVRGHHLLDLSKHYGLAE